jgi:hypothetical protein
MDNISISVINNDILEINLKFSVKSIKLKIFEEFNKVSECIYLTFSSEQTQIPIRVKNANGNIFIEITEINNQQENYGIFKMVNNTNEVEKIETLDNIKNLFGQQEISLTNSTVEETNQVFNNFGKGLSTLFGTKQIVHDDFNFSIVKKK